ncbi:hypothetical protein BXZ70DRAFT_917574 [Cristinia sonorae]|uniref:C2H2-type domain-containing protein n=1 Tax=Cristinia sonorae TaxID=1940300 RepID=A0A8K0UVP3_9AGAR|nr:hypothetical protein BXZ70DRAFT_917574 [Cristinia sonorae]
MTPPPSHHDCEYAESREQVPRQYSPERPRPPVRNFGRDHGEAGSSNPPSNPPTRTATPPPEPQPTEPITDSDWRRYARVDQKTQRYTCTWMVLNEDTGIRAPCHYHSKKHLVKRHIESVHLQIKPLKCAICGKQFSQQTNLNTHINTHTGEMPHKCLYPGCEKRFGDPARRHRHMKKVHHHVPSKRRTQNDLDGTEWSPVGTLSPPGSRFDPPSPTPDSTRSWQ